MQPMLLRRLEHASDPRAARPAPGCVRMLAPLILDRREADVVVEALAAIILASRPPRRRSIAAPHRRRRRGRAPRAARCAGSGRVSERSELADRALGGRQLSRSTIIAIP